MHPNAQTLQRFYTAFAQLDHATMAACYAPHATFDDEAFSLRGHEQVTGMWHMLCEATRAKGRDFLGVQAEAVFFQGHMQALDPRHFTKAHGQLAVIGVVHLHAIAPLFLGHVAGHVGSAQRGCHGSGLPR